jgi:hypothetical protein
LYFQGVVGFVWIIGRANRWARANPDHPAAWYRINAPVQIFMTLVLFGDQVEGGCWQVVVGDAARWRFLDG